MDDYPHVQLTRQVIGCAIEVHRALGPGLLESAYSACLQHDLERQRIPFLREAAIPLRYKALEIDTAYRADFVVAGKIIIEVKSVERIERVHHAQVLTYLRLACLQVGLLLNFNVPVLKSGIHRIFRRGDLVPVAACTPCIE